MSEQKNLNLNDLKNKKVLKKRAELNDEALDKATGGYWESAGYAAGYWIECPNCGRSDFSDFATWEDHPQRCDQFRCVCGAAFAVDEYGNVYY